MHNVKLGACFWRSATVQQQANSMWARNSPHKTPSLIGEQDGANIRHRLSLECKAVRTNDYGETILL